MTFPCAFPNEAAHGTPRPDSRRVQLCVLLASILAFVGFTTTAQEFELGELSLNFGTTAASDPEFSLEGNLAPSAEAQMADDEFELVGGFTGASLPVPAEELPRLHIQPAAGGVLISWPAPSAFVLESTTQLSPAAWSPVAEPPVQYEEKYSVTIPVTAATQFFRLRQAISP